MIEVYYFGAWGEPGHLLWTPAGRTDWEAQRALPWPELDGVLAGDPELKDPHRRNHWSTDNQPEGRARLHHRDGWTALAFWDRSCDSRYGSNSVLFARGTLSAAEMLALFELHFPAVWRRITLRFQVSMGDW